MPYAAARRADAPEASRKATPIIFSDAMVTAIREGRKTQTRRIVRGGANLHTRAQILAVADGVATFGDSIPDDPVPLKIACPYGTVGDLLWVKEAWARGGDGKVAFRADSPVKPEDTLFWKSPIYMSRAISRIQLEITDVRCQRLRSITETDALAEGIERSAAGTFVADDAEFERASTAFFFKWDGINGHRGGHTISDASPIVWALTFRRAGSPS